jgi:hypothetical protein
LPGALLLAGCTGSVDHQLGQAPDVVLVHSSSEHGPHRWVVRRPTVWQVDGESRILDDRMTVALLDQTTATWHAAVRLDELAALQFASELQTAMHGADPASAVQGVQLAFQASPRDGNLRGRTLIDGGRWIAPEPQSGVPVRIHLVDDTGHVHMRVECDAISAGALRRDLLLAASARP